MDLSANADAPQPLFSPNRPEAPSTFTGNSYSKKQERKESDPEKGTKRAAVKSALERYQRAKKKHEPAFKIMRDCMDFMGGYQRHDQSSLEGDEYTANITQKLINNKVATLYAKNPQAEYQRRKRREYVLWDEKEESLQPIAMKIMAGAPLQAAEMALIQDYLHGKQVGQLIDSVGDTFQKLYQFQIDEHDPDFKLQMKALVRRVCECGVGYVKLSFEREHENQIVSTGMGNALPDTIKRLEYLTEALKDDSADISSNPRVEQIKLLMNSLMLTMSGQQAEFKTLERLVFDFLAATSVIPDEYCTNLKGFVGAREVFIESILPLEEVNEFFECDIKVGGNLKLYSGDGKVTSYELQDPKVIIEQPKVCLIECFNKSTQSHCFLVEGYADYVQEPEPVEPAIRNFWPVFSLTFNDCESDPACKIGIFPPSDVFLIMSPQREINRIRDELTKHRCANAAKYLAKKGSLTQEDLDALENGDSNTVVEIQGADSKEDVGKIVTPLVHDPIAPGDPRYDSAPQFQDILMCVGSQEANIGPPNPKGTATGQAIAEQSRSTGLGSNIDDVDDFLGQLCGAGFEMLVQEISLETAQRIVGPGAVVPQANRTDFLDSLYLKHVASSSGKPNKALELQNWTMIRPFLAQAGANPQFLVREDIRRVDDRLDPTEAFPLIPTTQPGQPQPGVQPQQQQLQPHQTAQQPRSQRRPGPGRLRQGGSNVPTGPRPQQVANMPQAQNPQAF